MGVDIVVSGLGDLSEPSLETFDLDLSYDPSVLRATEVEPTSVFAVDNVHALREAKPGLLVAATSARGHQAGIDAPDTALSVIDFDVLSAGKSRVDFIAERSAIVGSDGKRASGGIGSGAKRTSTARWTVPSASPSVTRSPPF